MGDGPEEFDLDRERLKLDRERFEFDKKKFGSEDTFSKRNSTALISAAVAVVGIAFSAGQFFINQSNNQRQAIESAKNAKRQYQVSLANLLFDNFDRFRSNDEKLVVSVRNIIISSFPADFANTFFVRMASTADDKLRDVWVSGIIIYHRENPGYWKQ